MNDLVTDIKALKEETLKNLQSSKANNTVRAISPILKILDYFVYKTVLKTYLLIQRQYLCILLICRQRSKIKHD